MKKLFTVLAVLLVASLAFAGFSGSVKAQYTFNFDERTIGYAKPDFGKVDVTFGWDSPVYTVGEAEGTHIEFALSTNFKGFYNLSGDHADGYDPFKKNDAWTWSYVMNDNSNSGDKVTVGDEFFYYKDRSSAVVAGINLKVDTFKIVGSNWEVSFISDLGLDFAKSAIDSKRFNKYTLEDNTQYYSMSNNVKGKHNLVATVAGYKFGFGLGADKDWTNEITFALTGVTPEYDFNGVKAQFGAGYEVTGKVYTLAASAKASYATDKLAVSGAYDAKLSEVSATNSELFLLNDLALKFDFAPVAVDVFFANEGAKVTDKYEKYFWKWDGDKPYYVPSYVAKSHSDGTSITKGSNYLSAQVVVDVARVAENVPVTVTLSGSDLLTEDEQVVSVEAETTIVPNFKFGVYFDDWFARDVTDSARKLGATVEFTGIEKITLNGEVAYRFADADHDTDKKLFILAGASYAHELFTASASVAAEKNYKSDMVLGAKASVVSTTLVKGAELSAKAYFNLNALDGIDEKYHETNELALACKVSF